MKRASFLSKISLGMLMLVAVGVFCQSTANAQIATTAFVQRYGTYTEITGGSVLGTSTGYADDEGYALNLPFTFTYNGVGHTTVYPCTNGYITVGASDPYIYSYPLAYTSYSGATGVISPWAWDLHGNYTGEMRSQVDGVAPNRVVTIQWKNWHYYYAGTETMNFQVKIFETSNMIQFVYGPCTNTTARSANVGLRGTTADVHARQGVATAGWDNTTQTNYGYAVIPFTTASIPTDGLIYVWGCYVQDNALGFDIIDPSTGLHQTYAYLPANLQVDYKINFPNEAFNATITLNFYRVGDPSPLSAYTTTFNVAKPVGPYTGSSIVSVPQLTPGFYRVVATFRTWNSCLLYENNLFEQSLMLLAPGMSLCEVWPGDVNIDKIVNYVDRKALNTYIHDANLRPTWLNGYARFRSDGAKNPLGYIQWESQVGLPWITSEGCHMDTDGNGYVNNLDYIAIRVNWMKTHGPSPAPKASALEPSTFDMSQNYPNPFNPSTKIDYTVPEASQVSLVVTDMLGRTVQTLVNGRSEAGSHSVVFDASSMTSGNYVATISIVGLESGLSFTKTVKMTLNK